MNPRNFFAELKRRNVYKVAIAYAVVGWLLIQIATSTFPVLEIPNWAIKLVIALVLLGFPIALILAWAFELTSEGIKRAEDVDLSKSITHKTGRKLTAAIIVIALIAAGLLVFRFVQPKSSAVTSSATTPTATAAPTISQKSVAVLPFENLSDEKANAYFASGIQDEILTRLAKIADLKVISRASTQQYGTKPGNLLEIARQLGVAHILEGSVQKVGDQVRVNVQLINASTDSHLWADTYDRKLTDIFAVESEIAKSIAAQLQAKLTGREEQAFGARPTNNPEAYDAYLHGLAAEAQVFHSIYAMEDAARYYEQAVQLDPAFALAWSRLSRADSLVFSSPIDPTPSRREAAKRALETAQKLQPDSPETLLALAYYQRGVLNDLELARTTFEKARELWPSNSEIPAALARIARAQGRWDDSTANSERALLLDPRDTEMLDRAADGYMEQRKFEAALRLYDRALDIRPNDPEIMASKAAIYQAQGNLQEAARLLGEVNPQTASIGVFSVKLTQLTLERNFREAVRLAQARVAQFPFRTDSERGVFNIFLAVTQNFAGDRAGAQAAAEKGRSLLEPLCRTQPENDFAAVMLSRAYAVLGEKAAAINEAQRVIAIPRSAKDAVWAPGREENLAAIQAIFGETASAISTLARLLKVPYASSFNLAPVTPALLRLDPTWDPLRDDPGFQQLLAGTEHVGP